jgi:uncharacterized repeat protein (TIGR03843 family)
MPMVIFAPIAMDTAPDILARGQLQMEGQVTWGSNFTFLVQVCYEDAVIDAIYKPQRGERPLWDFASGTLCHRERAAYLLSEAAGWSLVPLTLLRDGPYGYGAVQLFVDHDPEAHYFTFEGQFPDQLQRIVLFDHVANNADRKSGHVLRDGTDRLWAIDHGVCFHEQYKLRTVIWEFAGQPIPTVLQGELLELQRRLAAADDPLTTELQALLAPGEWFQIQRRLQKLLDAGTFPVPGRGRPYPWPLV